MRATIESGSSISHYRVLSPLGSGGMGEVYVARDTRLERTVALKILPPALTASEERVRRFVQEAKSASSLSHPHIVTIHEIGHAEVTGDGDTPKSDAVHFIAMELIEGQTLGARIHNENADLKTLLEYLKQAAEGLAKAHAAGIVHRDLKPDNIMVTRDGYAKVLDFGLAKLLVRGTASGSSEVATAVRHETRDGVILGTVGYMSPEQVQGKQTDHRADIFSFGCILYEAATRRRAFAADSDVDIMHRILHDKPEPIDTINPAVPSELRRLIRRCLAKDPEKRYQSMKDLALELSEIVDEFDELSLTADSRPSVGSGGFSDPAVGLVRRRPALTIGILAGALAIVVIGGLAVWKLASKETASAGAFASMKITRLTSSGNIADVAISPDNRYLANVSIEGGKHGLVVRQIATGADVQIVPPGPARIRGVTFSPDGNYLYFIQAESEQSGYSSAYQVPSLGGSPRKVVFDIDTSVAFSPDGKQFAFVRGYPQRGESALLTVNADGSEEKTVAVRKSPGYFSLLPAAWSPDGSTIVVVGGRGTDPELVAVDTASGKERRIGSTNWYWLGPAAWMPDGKALVFTANERVPGARSQLWLLDYPSGPARRITNDLNDYRNTSLTSDGSTIATIQSNRFSNLWSFVPGVSESPTPLTRSNQEVFEQPTPLPDGSMFLTVGSNGHWSVAEITPSGERKRLTSGGDFAGPTVSRDGSVILVIRERDGRPYVARMDRDGSVGAELTKGQEAVDPAIAPDGTWFAFTTPDGELWRMPTGGGDATRIADRVRGVPHISPDGGTILTTQFQQNLERATEAFVLFPAAGGAPTTTIERDGHEFRRFSPAGDAIDYVMNENGVSNIWRQPIAGGAPVKLTAFTEGKIGSFAWMPDGKTLVFVRPERIDDVVLISDYR